MTTRALAQRGPRLERDSARVVTRMFIPGQEGFDHEDSRTAAVLARVMALSDDDVDVALADVAERFAGRHRDYWSTLRQQADRLDDRLDPSQPVSDQRRLLIGATFTNEYSIEAAALCNPSMVVHPDQDGVARGSVRFVMSVRGIGEGHQSSIGFRTGIVGASGSIEFDGRPRYASTGRVGEVPVEAGPMRTELERRHGEGENADFILNGLGATFTRDELEQRVHALRAGRETRLHAERTIALIRSIADKSYRVEFGAETTLQERVLTPATRAEAAGIEDARFVRLVDEGAPAYVASYTAHDGSRIAQQLLATDDFRNFTSRPLTGEAATNKGLALFPRRVHGRFAALSRHDRETNSIAYSDDLHEWRTATPLQVPARAWEVLQLGNCGAPIETDAGWLVLTHGVGPMRTYSIGALLLDLDEPGTVLASLPEPLLTPNDSERDGYVPNVVYSCGALAHGDVLVVPYGISDGAIGTAVVSINELIDAMVPSR